MYVFICTVCNKLCLLFMYVLNEFYSVLFSPFNAKVHPQDKLITVFFDIKATTKSSITGFFFSLLKLMRHNMHLVMLLRNRKVQSSLS